MIEKLQQIKPILLDWERMGRNYSPSFDWVDMNNLAVQLGNQPFNLGCSSCRTDLANYLLAVIKEKNI